MWETPAHCRRYHLWAGNLQYCRKIGCDDLGKQTSKLNSSVIYASTPAWGQGSRSTGLERNSLNLYYFLIWGDKGKIFTFSWWNSSVFFILCFYSLMLFFLYNLYTSTKLFRQYKNYNLVTFCFSSEWVYQLQENACFSSLLHYLNKVIPITQIHLNLSNLL